MTTAREPEAPPKAKPPMTEPARLRDLTKTGLLTPARSSVERPSDRHAPRTEAALEARNTAPDDAVQSERFAALIDRARDTIWARADELQLPESDTQATVSRVEAYLKQMDHIRNEVRAGRLDRRLAKDQLTQEREALHSDLDELLGPATHDALRGAIPAKY